jgi:hypothetical protein
MKKIYTALFALGLALGAEAQSSYKLDSTFNSVGSKIYTTDFPNASIRGCFLNDNGTMLVAGRSSFNSTNTRYVASIDAAGGVTTSLCNGICTDSVGASYYNNVYKLGSNYYIASSAYGGDAIINNMVLDNQTYNKNDIKTLVSVQFDNTTIIEAESGQGAIYAYKVNAAGSGYAGTSGIINGALYPHGGPIQPIPGSAVNGITINSIGVQANKSILIAGSMYDLNSSLDLPFIVRYKPNTLVMDSTFGTNGLVTLSTTQGEITNMEIDANDNIYAFYGYGANAKMVILNPNGSIKTTASQGGIIPMPWTIYNATVTKQGTLLITLDGGPSDAKVFCLTLNGNPLNTFYNNSNELVFANVLPSFTYLTFANIASDVYGNLALHGYSENASSSGWKGTIVKLKTLNPVAPASISQGEFKNTNIDIYPNPASNSISFSLDKLADNAMASVYSMDGKWIASQSVKNNKTIVNVEELSKGIYMLQVKNGEQVFNSTFIKE